MNIEKLKQYGINYESGLRRFMNNGSLYEEMLILFLQDTTCERAEKCYAEGKNKEFGEVIHEIKGISGNLDMTKLYEISKSIMEEIRSAESNPDKIHEMFLRFKTEYKSVKEGIKISAEEGN